LNPKKLAVASALGVSLLTATVLPSRLAGGAVTPAPAPARTGAYATLVRVNVFSTNEAPAQPVATRDRMRTGAAVRPNTDAVKGVTNFAQCKTPGAGTGAYNRTGTRVTAPTTAHLKLTGAPAGAASAIQAGFNTWRAAEPAAPAITVATDGTTSAPTANHRYDLMFKNLGGRTLAITYTWHWSTGEYENDIAFNRAMSWFIAPGEGDGCYDTTRAFDVQDVATHEIGHVYGLGHVSSPYNTMASTATTGETYKRSLASGDIAGIQGIY